MPSLTFNAGLGGFELRSVFLFKCPAPGKSSWVKKVQTPNTRVINVGQKDSTNDQKPNGPMAYR